MCGFAALYSYATQSAPVDRKELAAASSAMARRGPDGKGQWLSGDGRVGLAHRRLSIIDLSDAAAQPMALDGGRLVISYNGEIYNYQALRRELETRGRVFRTNSDTEVLLQLYDAFGRDMVHKLRGMFAFALWDNDHQQMLLARDPFGIKPLYYATGERGDGGGSGVFRAASQVKALVAGAKESGWDPGGADAAGHAGFFLFGYVPDPHTLYAGIHALAAGHTLMVDSRGPGDPQPYFDVTEALSGDNEGNSAAPDLRALLSDSVAHHLVSDVPVGVFLSSGLDSAVIAALAAEQNAALETVTLAFEEFEGTSRDEAPLAETIAGSIGARQHTVRVSGQEFHKDMGALLDAMDQPTIDGVNVYFVARAAARAGMKVALSGLGGDELFQGYNTFTQVPRLAGLASRVPGGPALGRAFRIAAAPILRNMTSPKAAGLLELGGTCGGAYLLRRGLFMPWELPAILGPDMAAEGLRALRPVERLGAAQAQVAGGRRKVAAMEMVWYMRNQLLRDADWAGMAHGVEVRVPLVDETLFNFLAPVIGRDGAPKKTDMAMTPEKPLPDAVLKRPKTGFDVPVRDWLRGRGATGPGAPEKERGLRGWAKTVYAAQWPQ